MKASWLVRARQTIAPKVHRALQLTETAFQKGYVSSLRAQARLSGFPLPIPQLGVVRGSSLTSGGGIGTFARWNAIEKLLPKEGGLAIDIGSHTGFLSLALAERGFEVIGYEPALRLFRIASEAASHAGGQFVGFMPVGITPFNVDRVMTADVTLALSVFHDWCEASGYDDSVRILKTVWSKTRRILFFEMPNTAENPTIRPFVPDMGDSPEAAGDYIARLLADLEDSEVSLLGHFPTDFRGAEERRHLFAVTRRPVSH